MSLEAADRGQIAGHASRLSRSNRIPGELLAERDALVAARELRALTEDFCGDPPAVALKHMQE